MAGAVARGRVCTGVDGLKLNTGHSKRNTCSSRAKPQRLWELGGAQAELRGSREQSWNQQEGRDRRAQVP